MADESNVPVAINEQTFGVACDEAGFWAKKRCLKKMTKVIYRVAYAPVAPARPDEIVPKLVTRPPKDAEDYVKRFVEFYYNRAQAKAGA